MFAEMTHTNESQTKFFRWASWLGSTFGHYLLFAPLIQILAFIPLVGSLLASVFALAAFIFAVVWATSLHLLLLGLAWLFYRPLYGILLLSVFGILMGVMFAI